MNQHNCSRFLLLISIKFTFMSYVDKLTSGRQEQNYFRLYRAVVLQVTLELNLSQVLIMFFLHKEANKYSIK